MTQSDSALNAPPGDAPGDSGPPVEGRDALTQRLVDRVVARRGLRPRNAAFLVVCTWLVAIVVFGVLQRLVDPKTFPTVWKAWWWAIQTVTTVGYGDVVPDQTAGKLVAAVLMLGGLSFLSVLTAMITSTFVARRQARLRAQGEDPVVLVAARLEEMSARLDAIQAELAHGAARPPAASDGPS